MKSSGCGTDTYRDLGVEALTTSGTARLLFGPRRGGLMPMQQENLLEA